MERADWEHLSRLLDEALALDAEARALWLQALHQRDPATALALQRMLVNAPDAAAESGASAAPNAAPNTAPDTEPHTASDAKPSGDTTRTALPGDPVAQLLRRAWAASVAAGAVAGTNPGTGGLTGRALGAWTLQRKIGEGGMGQVWLAERSDGLYSAQAAIKLLRSDLPADSLAARFARERAVLARLNHPGIARLLDAGVADEQAYLVLEYVQGLPLAEHVKQVRPDVAGRVRLVMQIAEAVDHAHAHLVVHRDLKPANVIVTPEGEPKLLDFGIAGLLGHDARVDGQLTNVIGRRLTLNYAAPEQLSGAPVGVTADVFALGVMLFELLSGKMPFDTLHPSRTAAERALLHDQARRLGDTGNDTGPHKRAGTGDAAASRRSPIPRPADFKRARGDLEAIAAKALRKDPAERYGSMRVFIDDLRRWLTFRPVSVRRNEWQHRAALWLRRHALAASAVAGITLALAGGLTVSVWQWQRAEAAARTSEQVTRYLGELLASASPDKNGGTSPTVMQLLETSRKELSAKFANDPETLIRLLQVLGATYNELNRYDVAIPLAEQRVVLANQVYGQGDTRSLQARLDLARIYAPQGSFDKVITLLEPLRSEVRQRFGAKSEEQRSLLYMLAYAYSRVDRMDEADAALAEGGRLTDAMFPPGSLERLQHLNQLQVLRVNAGRLREGLAALKQTEPYWSRVPKSGQRFVLVFKRNLLAVQIRLGEYDGVAERGAALLAEIDTLLGPGNDMAAGLHAELARAFTETGRYDLALAQRRAVVERAAAASINHPALWLPPHAHLLLARGVAQDGSPATLRTEARMLLGELVTRADAVGFLRSDALMSIARLGVVLQDNALASDALAALRADAGLRLTSNRVLQSRAAQVEGALARAESDLPRSRDKLQVRTHFFESMPEPVTAPAWSAQLDLACTLLAQRDPGAAAALARAAQLRPPGMPKGVPLDALQDWLQQWQRQGNDQDPSVRAAWERLASSVNRPSSGPGMSRWSIVAAALL